MSTRHLHPSIQNEMQCERCKALNPPEYRFCGSCGNLLQREPGPVALTDPSPGHNASVSGPSFLGLGESSEDNHYSYLLEEEPSRHRVGKAIFTIMLLLLLGAAAYVAYWKFYFVPDHISNASVPPVPVFAYEHTPAPSELAIDPAQIPLPSRKVVDQKSLDSLAAQANASAKRVAPSTASHSAPPEPRGSEADNTMEEAPSQATKLIAEGEKYLYGRGVPSNCKQAVKSFQTASELDNAKAMARLGSLYASGRCVTFDRVKAYQWFAKARNADPNDTWAEASMDMLWRSMNRKERAAILK